MRRRNVFNTTHLIVESFDLKNVVLRQREIVDDFCREKIKSPDGTVIVHITDPVQVLLNQERLENIVGNTLAKSFIDSFRNQQTDPFAELKAQCSDEDLCSMIKSRHLQSPAEILSWTQHMKNNMEYFTSEVQKLIEARTSETTESSNSLVEPPKSE